MPVLVVQTENMRLGARAPTSAAITLYKIHVAAERLMYRIASFFSGPNDARESTRQLPVIAVASSTEYLRSRSRVLVVIARLIKGAHLALGSARNADAEKKVCAVLCGRNAKG